jgi:predicted transposase YbfD/YdcC
MPSHHTYRRILAEVIDEEEFEELSRECQRHKGKAGYQVVVALAGKVVRGTIDAELSDGLCLLAVYLPGEGVTLAQVAIQSKQNEITAAPSLLGYVDLRNLEVRTLTTSSQLNDFLDWPFLQQVFKLERQVVIQKTGKTRHQVVFGITSLSADHASPNQLLHMLRSYWHIENNLHYPRDVTLHEDQTRFKKRSAAHNMAIINNIVLGLMTRSAFLFVPVARRYFAAYPDQALALLL